MGSAKDIDTAKAEFKAPGSAFRRGPPPEDFAAAYEAMDIRDDG
jgi:hypothetical protein